MVSQLPQGHCDCDTRRNSDCVWWAERWVRSLWGRVAVGVVECSIVTLIEPLPEDRVECSRGWKLHGSNDGQVSGNKGRRPRKPGDHLSIVWMNTRQLSDFHVIKIRCLVFCVNPYPFRLSVFEDFFIFHQCFSWRKWSPWVCNIDEVPESTPKCGHIVFDPPLLAEINFNFPVFCLLHHFI